MTSTFLGNTQMKLFTLAATIAALATPALAQTAQPVDLRGQTPAAAYRTLADAADAVCRKQARGDALAFKSVKACARDALARAVAATGSPELVAYAAPRGRALAQQTVASR